MTDLLRTSPLKLTERVPASWRELLDGEGARALESVEAFLDSELEAGRGFQPAADRLFRALELTAPEAVRCVLTGQDPYPTPGVPTGLSFDVGADAKLPASLKNIYREYMDDLGLPAPSSGDLSPWTVHTLLLNAALSCQPGAAGSHAKAGWQQVTRSLLTGLVGVNPDVVFICWGQPALRVVQKLPPVGKVVFSTHPSPLAAYRGFFGSKPFTRANQALAELGRDPVDWRLP